MYHYNSGELSQKQQYKFISGSVIPRPIAWITTLSPNGKVVNAAPFSFFSAASNEIPLLTASIIRKNGTAKDTARNILDSHEAVIHIVDNETVEDMNKTAAPLSENESEIDRTTLSLIESKTINPPAIKKAKIRFETTLYQHVPIKNVDGNIVTDLFLLKVTDFYFDKEVFDPIKEYIIPEVLQPTARLSGNSYSKLGDLFFYTRPTE